MQLSSYPKGMHHVFFLQFRQAADGRCEANGAV